MVLVVAGLVAFAADPEDLYQRCVVALQGRDWPGAVDACKACVDADPRGARAGACADRAGWLDARRDESGGWDSLNAFMAARDGGTSAELEALSVTNRVIRAEAVIALLHRQLDAGLVDDAIRTSEPWMADLEGLPRDVRRKLIAGRAEALARAGREDDALALSGPGEGRWDTPYAEAVEVWRTADDVASVAQGILVVYGALAAPLALLGWKRRPRPVPTGAVPVFVWGSGAVVVTSWVTPPPLSVLAHLIAGLILIHLASAGVLLYLVRPWLRWPFRVAALIATVAVGYLAWYRLQFA